MKANNYKKQVDEGWFRNWMDSQTGGKYSKLKGEDPNEIKNPKVIQEIIRIGVDDYIKRLRTEGIEIGDSASVAANIDRIKESVTEYVQAYMTSREDKDAVSEILIKLKPIVDSFSLLPTINLNSIKKFFSDSAMARADALISLKSRLKPSSKLPAISNIASLMANIPDKNEIVFPTSFTNTAGDKVWAFIRKEGVYFDKLPNAIESAVTSGRINSPPTTKIKHNNNDYSVYTVRSPSNLQQVYDEFIRYNGGTVPTTLTGIARPISYDL